MIIDSHLHVYADDDSQFPYVQGGKPNRPAAVEYLLPLMDEAGVDKAAIVQPRTYSWDNRYIADCIRRFPDRFTALGLVDPVSADGPDKLEELVREHGFDGLRLELGWEKDLDDFHGQDRWPLWERAQELGAAFGLLGSALDHSCVEPMAARFPGVNILLDHLNGLPLDPEKQAPLFEATMRLAKYPNVHVKVSNVQGKSKQDYPFPDTYDLIERIFDTYGPQRLLWGTDFPGVMVKCGYSNAVELVRTHIPFFTADDKEWIFHKTAEKIFRRLGERSNRGEVQE
jgi:L-fuconolactonase